MKKNLIVYHRVDYDGIFSCGISKQYYETVKELSVDIQGHNYNDEPLNIPQLLDRYATITLVDISLPPDQMIELKDSSRAVWIDHHVTAINDSIKFGYNNMPGLREIGTAACELCWRFYWRTPVPPPIIQILGSYDVWDKTRFDWEEIVLPLQFGLKTRYGIRIKDILNDWDYLLREDNYKDVLDDGYAVYSFLKDNWKSWVKNCAFEVTVAGKYRGICLLSPMFGSSSFESINDKYEIYIVANVRTNGTTYSLSMYKESAEMAPEFSCGEYMKQFGGGGHATAASSGALTKEHFEKLVFNHEI